MKKIILLSIMIITGSMFAADVVEDEVSMGAGSVNQVWYSMETGEVKNSAGLDWHIAFQKAQFDAGVLANGPAGVKVYHVENLEYDQFLTELSADDQVNWVQYYNSDYSWDVGAINRDKYGFEVDEEDYGWGNYDMGSHGILGYAIYVIELPNSKYYKFMIDRREISGKWYFKYAELDDTDGSTVVDEVLDMNNYGPKNFVYFNFNTGIIDREPESYLWDITFTKWTKLIEMETGELYPYPVTGVKSNILVAVSQADNVSLDDATPPNEIEYSENLTEIGDDWKELLTMDPVEYEVWERVYFIRAVSGDIYKLQFTDYEGSSTGVIKFNKQPLTTSVNEDNSFAFAVYPNVIGNSGTINIVTDNQINRDFQVELRNLQGQIVLSKAYNSSGFNTNVIDINNLNSGMYFLTIMNGDFVKTEKIIVR
jgi:hypothetical protein